MAVEVRRGNLGNEKLGAIGIRSSIGIGQLSRNVEPHVGGYFIWDRVAWSACTRAQGIAALDHEVGNRPMKDGAVVKRHATLLFPAFRVCPFFSAERQADEIVN